MFENRFGSTDTFKMVAVQIKMAHANFFLNIVTLSIIVGLAPNLRHRGTLGAPSICHTWTLAPKLFGLEWCNLGKS